MEKGTIFRFIGHFFSTASNPIIKFWKKIFHFFSKFENFPPSSFGLQLGTFLGLGQRYRIFLFSGKSSTFAIFGQKSSEWVKMLLFFFPVLLFFFLLLNLGEWVYFKLFLGKKNTSKFLEKNGKKSTPRKFGKFRKTA